MSKIQGIPRGLLELLGQRAGGINPSDLSQEVRPTVELADFYLANNVDVVQDTQSGLSALDAAAVVTVPLGQLWRVTAISGMSTAYTAGASSSVSVGIRDSQGQFVRLAADDNTARLANTRYPVAFSLGSPVILPAGWNIELLIDRAVSAGTTQLVLRSLVQVLRT